MMRISIDLRRSFRWLMGLSLRFLPCPARLLHYLRALDTKLFFLREAGIPLHHSPVLGLYTFYTCFKYLPLSSAVKGEPFAFPKRKLLLIIKEVVTPLLTVRNKILGGTYLVYCFRVASYERVFNESEVFLC